MRKIKHCPTNVFKIQWQNKTVYLFLDTIIDHRKEKMNTNSSLFSTHKFKLKFKFKVMNLSVYIIIITKTERMKKVSKISRCKVLKTHRINDRNLSVTGTALFVVYFINRPKLCNQKPIENVFWCKQ